MQRQGFTSALVALCVGGASLLSGCTPGQAAESGQTPTGVSPIYESMMRRVLDGNPTELESKVLEDLVIEDSEFQAAIDEFGDCMKSNGLDPIVETNPLGFRATEESVDTFVVGYADRDEGLVAVTKATRGCAEGNLTSIGLIYSEMHNNPEGKSFGDMLRECLTAAGIDADALSDEEIDQLTNGETLPGLDTPEVNACVANPQAG